MQLKVCSSLDLALTTPLLTWGEYEIVESVVPDDYLDDGYSTTVRIPEEPEPQPVSFEE